MSRPKVLVIDDEPGMLRAVSRILESDHHVGTAVSPELGLELIETTKPDLVVCDLSMPRIDGLEVMRRAKASRPGVDFILMTGVSDPDPHLLRAIREQAFYFIEKPFNREVLRALVERCLELRRLRQSERRHLKRIEDELREARAFQRTMLPRTPATIEGVAIAARNVACTELCGDIYDCAAAGPGRVALLIADVAGHGVSASLLTAVVKSAFRSSASDGYAPQSVAARVIEGIASFSDRRFITLISGLIDVTRQELRYVNAGHPPGVLRLVGSGQLQRLEVTGPMFSPAFVGETWSESSVPFPTGSDLFLFTDGISDAYGDGGELFTDARILEAVRSESSGGEPLLDAVLCAVHTFSGGRPQSDDLTLLTARVSPT